MSSLELIGKECLRVQLEMAGNLANTLGHRIYIFCPTNFFSTPPFDTVIYNSIRTVLKNGKTALLSSSAQAVVKTNADFRKLIPPTRISEDAVGVYINP